MKWIELEDMINKCIICGREFEASHKLKKTCSDECRKKQKHITDKKYQQNRARKKRMESVAEKPVHGKPVAPPGAFPTHERPYLCQCKICGKGFYWQNKSADVCNNPKCIEKNIKAQRKRDRKCPRCGKKTDSCNMFCAYCRGLMNAQLEDEEAMI